MVDNEKAEAITDGLNTWAEYFRKKLTPRIMTEYRELIEPYSLDTINRVMRKVLHERDFFPKLYEIKPLFAELETLPNTYDEIEDFDFPLDKLHTGLGILRRKGYERFAAYCERVRMPQNDRQRVLAKYEHSSSKQFVPGGNPDPDHIPDNLKPQVDQIGENVRNA